MNHQRFCRPVRYQKQCGSPLHFRCLAVKSDNRDVRLVSHLPALPTASESVGLISRIFVPRRLSPARSPALSPGCSGSPAPQVIAKFIRLFLRAIFQRYKDGLLSVETTSAMVSFAIAFA